MRWVSLPPEEYVISNDRLARMYDAWEKVFDQVLALQAYGEDPDSDLDLILAVEEAYEVRL